MRACRKYGGALSQHCCDLPLEWISVVEYARRPDEARANLYLILFFRLFDFVLFIFRCSSADYISAKRSRFLFFNELKYFMCVDIHTCTYICTYHILYMCKSYMYMKIFICFFFGVKVRDSAADRRYTAILLTLFF